MKQHYSVKFLSMVESELADVNDDIQYLQGRLKEKEETRESLMKARADLELLVQQSKKE